MIRRFVSSLGSLPVRALLAVGLAALCLWPDAPPPAAQAKVAHDDVGYPFALWRLAPQLTNGVLVNVQHLLVCHRESSPDGLLFVPPGACDRSVSEARSLALELAARASAEPSRFDELVRRHSEDAATATHAGRLGVRKASGLPDEMLDALAQLQIGEISRPIATTHGFHIVRRLPMPAEQTMSVQQILVKYDGIDGPARADAPRRSREQARQRATEIERALAADPGRFGSFVASDSDALERDHDGDMGNWSTLEPCPFALERDVLAGMPVGQIAGPFDTNEGFRFVRRVALKSREELAASGLTFARSGDPAGDAHARELARQLAVELAARPSDWSALAATRCTAPSCRVTRMRFHEGRELESWEATLQGLALGAVSPEPAEGPTGFSVLRRDDPRDLPKKRTFSFELPVPTPRTLAYYVETLPGYPLAYATGQLADDMADRLALGGETRDAYADIMSALATRFRSGPDSERSVALQTARGELLRVLGTERMRTLDREIDAWLVSAQLGVL
jgi:hypothetical protein